MDAAVMQSQKLVGGVYEKSRNFAHVQVNHLYDSAKPSGICSCSINLLLGCQ